MTQLEISKALYDARNGYLKAQQQLKFYQNEISFLKMCEDAMKIDLYAEMFPEV